jgi:hypothetical protein
LEVLVGLWLKGRQSLTDFKIHSARAGHRISLVLKKFGFRFTDEHVLVDVLAAFLSLGHAA